MAASKLHRSVESSRSPDGFQGKAGSPRHQLVAEAEEPVTVSTCWGQAGAVEVGFFEHRFSSANRNGTRMIPHHPQVPPLHAEGSVKEMPLQASVGGSMRPVQGANKHGLKQDERGLEPVPLPFGIGTVLLRLAHPPGMHVEGL